MVVFSLVGWQRFLSGERAFLEWEFCVGGEWSIWLISWWIIPQSQGCRMMFSIASVKELDVVGVLLSTIGLGLLCVLQ